MKNVLWCSTLTKVSSDLEKNQSKSVHLSLYLTHSHYGVKKSLYNLFKMRFHYLCSLTSTNQYIHKFQSSQFIKIILKCTIETYILQHIKNIKIYCKYKNIFKWMQDRWSHLTRSLRKVKATSEGVSIFWHIWISLVVVMFSKLLPAHINITTRPFLAAGAISTFPSCSCSCVLLRSGNPLPSYLLCLWPSCSVSGHCHGSNENTSQLACN